ncbi:hypothetical protein [Parvibaculum sedimenti]|nr:hypothetical protein [Parvibaculum sedimenti]
MRIRTPLVTIVTTMITISAAIIVVTTVIARTPVMAVTEAAR